MSAKKVDGWYNGKYYEADKPVDTGGVTAPRDVGIGTWKTQYTGDGLAALYNDDNNQYYVFNADGTIGGHYAGEGSDVQWLGEGGVLQTGATVVNTGIDIAKYLLGRDALKQQKKEFGAEVAFNQRNLENQGLAYNTALRDRAHIGAALGGMNQSEADAYVNSKKADYMDTSKVVV